MSKLIDRQIDRSESITVRFQCDNSRAEISANVEEGRLKLCCELLVGTCTTSEWKELVGDGADVSKLQAVSLRVFPVFLCVSW